MKEIHLNAPQAIPLARFASAALDVKAETARFVATFAGFREHGKKFANGRENAGVGGGIRARRAADRGLIDLNHFVDIFNAQNFAVRSRRF
jgi:hypothetical protein